MSSVQIPNIDTISNNAADKMVQDILTTLWPYLYIFIAVTAIICIMTVYNTIMISIIFKRINNKQNVNLNNNQYPRTPHRWR